jgi:muconolactone delta-isomerase
MHKKITGVDASGNNHVYTYMSSRLVLPLLLMLGFSVMAQTPPTQMPTVPTTRVLAIGRLSNGTTRDQVMPVMQREVRATVKLYLDGKLDQWFVRHDQNGVVFLLNVSSVEEAHALLEKLPLGVAKLMDFELIPLGPLSPLGLLLGEPGVAK